MSDSHSTYHYECAQCGRSESFDMPADRTPDSQFMVVRDGTGWRDVVASRPELYVHAQCCSAECALAWAERFASAFPLPSPRKEN